jgi:GntR family uxuAB operon transcriptional repressor
MSQRPTTRDASVASDGAAAKGGPMPGEAVIALAARILSDSRVGEEGIDRLPNERQLASNLGVSRTAIRHALEILEAEGRVTRQVGRGTFVRFDVSSTGTGREDGGYLDVGPAHVVEVRRLIEPQAMALVVAWATPSDFDEMDRCLAGGEASETYEEFEAWDLALHQCIIASTGNNLLVRLYEEIESARRGQLWGDLKRRRDSRSRRHTYLRQHKDIVAALRSRNADRAIEAMRVHIAAVESDLFGEPPP